MNIYFFGLLILLFLIYVFFGISKNIAIRRDTIKSSKITRPVKLAVISDLHGFMFGNHYDVIMNILKEEKPDFVLLPGDILDNTNKLDNSHEFINLIKDYTVYYALGNHEYRINNLRDELNKVKDLGITLLRNEKVDYKDDIRIIGVEDVWHDTDDEDKTAAIVNSLVDESKYNILLSHRPNFINLYKKSNVDLVISGHTHGGQWRIPFIDKPIYGPDQGLFPKYVKDIHVVGGTKCYISAGLATGRAYLPRLYNPSEIGIITLLPE